MSKSSTIEELYNRVNNEEDARICKDISDDACREVPANFFLLIVSKTFTKLGDALSNPKTVLAWLMSYVGAPISMIGFLVPIRESGSMLPQIFIASYIRRIPQRKWVWITGAIFQFLAVTGMGLAAIFFKGATAGWFILGLLVMFSLARGLSSVASKDVLGKTIPKTRRGRLNGVSASVSGLLAMAAGVFMLFRTEEEQDIRFYATIIFIAALTWVIGAALFAGIKEHAGETSGGGNAFREAINRLSLLREDRPFRRFVISRALLLCSALTAPFYVVLSHDHVGQQAYMLGLFIIASGIASTVSAPIWGNMADRSSKRVMVIAALITATLGIVMFIIITWSASIREMKFVYPLAFFLLGIAHSGVRLGRKTYIVDMAGGNKRTDYVAVSNTVIGLILLITGGISALASFISTEGIILILSLFGLAGAITSSRLPEVE